MRRALFTTSAKSSVREISPRSGNGRFWQQEGDHSAQGSPFLASPDSNGRHRSTQLG